MVKKKKPVYLPNFKGFLVDLKKAFNEDGYLILTTGALLYNTEIIDADKKLAKAFRKQSEYQNGITSSVDDYTNEEIEEFLGSMWASTPTIYRGKKSIFRRT